MSYQDRIQAEIDEHNETARRVQTLTDELTMLQQELLKRQGRITILQELALEDTSEGYNPQNA